MNPYLYILAYFVIGLCVCLGFLGRAKWFKKNSPYSYHHDWVVFGVASLFLWPGTVIIGAFLGLIIGCASGILWICDKVDERL